MSKVPQINREQLIDRLAKGNAPRLIDVLPDDQFRCSHLPGAVNACVYNVTFLEDVQRLVPNRADPVVVYGSSPRNLASTTAAEKLLAAGYTNVTEYRGGLDDWTAAGQGTDGDASPEKPEVLPRNGTHHLDLTKSRVEWTGRNLTGAHSGTVQLAQGHIEIEGGVCVGGGFTLDMDKIENTDIGDSVMRQMLIAHLKSDDFFDVQRFPKAEFQLASVTRINDAKPGSPSHEVTGYLTLKSVQRPLTFRAVFGLTAEGLLAADAHFDIDRTEWNVLYGSGKFYEKLGKHLVHDEISLALKLVTL